jgi:CubicO group peptidase (beta-lactamase class C family)
MTVDSTRRDFFRTAATAAAGATLVPVQVPFASTEETAAGNDEAPGVSDLQLDLERAIERHRVVGASATVYHGGSIETAAAGLVNVTTGVEVTDNTVMHIGSITKTINTTLVMQLVDDGLVELEAPVIEYLPEFKVKEPAATRAITVKMLLNHTSGIDGEGLPDQGHDEEILEKLVARAADMGQIHAPGKDCSYCNTGMTIAGYLAQRIRGEGWYDLIEQRIFKPLGLEHSVVLPEDALLHRASVGHFLNAATGEQSRTSHAFLPLSLAPAGATAMMSARDLLTFGVAHIGNGVGANGARILSEESARAMRIRTAKQKGITTMYSFGLGFMIGDRGDVGHGGGGPGVYSWLWIHPEEDFAMAVLTNSGHGMSVIADLINPRMEAATGIVPLRSERKPYLDIDFDPTLYVGVYENIAAESEVVEQNGGLAISGRLKTAFYDGMSLEKYPLVPLKPVAEHAFALALPEGVAPQMILSFVNPMADGRMEHVAFGGRLYRRTR